MWNFILAYRKRRVEADEVRRASIIDKERQAKEERNEQQQERRHREIIAALQKINDSNNTYSNNRRAEDSNHRLREVKRFRLDVAGVIVAGAAAVFLLWQQHTMQGQLEETRIDERPWLVISNIIVPKIEKISTSLNITFTYTIKNFGKNPASHIRLRYTAIDSVELAKIMQKANTLEAEIRAGQSHQLGGIAAPGQPRTLENLHVGLPISNENLRDGRYMPVLFVAVLYDAGGFSTPRITLSAFRLYAGDADNHGMTTEFLPVGIWSKDLVTPLTFVRLTEVDEVAEGS